MMLDRNRVGWPLAVLIAAFCALPLSYFAVIGGTSPQPASPPQPASAAMKPVTPTASAPPSLPVLAREDAAEPYDAGDTPSPAGVPPAVIVPARETVAMVKSDDRAIAMSAPTPEPPVRAFDAETLALLMHHGEQLAEAGDFAAARTLFQRAAEAGDAAAATALGATYDSVVLARMGAAGIDADIVKARFWYEKALRLGSSEARRRLELLANR
jgi:TPR repeat protein